MTETPTEHWTKIEDLIRELGAVRVEADSAKRGITDAAIHRHIEQVLTEAASAVDDTIDQVANRDSLLLAWEHLVRARDAIDDWRTSTAHTLQVIGESRDLKKRAERLMRDAEERARLTRVEVYRKREGA